MYDTATTRVFSNQRTCNKVVWGLNTPPEVGQLVPQPTVSPDGSVRNLYNGQLLNIVPEIFTNHIGTSDFIFQWVFNGWKFESIQSPPTISLIVGNYGNTLTLQPPIGIGHSAIADIGLPGGVLRDNRWIIWGICTLGNGSQRVVLRNNYVSFTDVFRVGEVIFIDSNIILDTPYYTSYYTVQEVIDDRTIVVHLNSYDVQSIGHTNWNDLNITSGGYQVYTVSTLLSFNNPPASSSYSAVIYPQTIVSINRASATTNNTTPVIKLNNTAVGTLLNTPSTFTPGWTVNCDCDVRLLYQIDTYTDSPVAGAQYVNIESPLFTSSRTFNTTTNSYSSTIATVPVIDNTVSYIQPVNNRNCSMYQINKNILNNFDIPFKITTDSNHTLYTPKNKTNFKIKFNLWFYSQTDDERYFYIPSL